MSFSISRFQPAYFLSAIFLSTAAQAQNPAPAELILQDQQNYQSLMADAEDLYSKELSALENSLNDYSHRHGIDTYSGIVILDPVKADVGSALGLPPIMIIKTMMMQEGIMPYDMFSTMLMHSMFTETTLSTGETSYTQDPKTLFVSFSDSRKSPCVIVPMPSNTVPQKLVFPSMDAETARTFGNLHEGAHCLDNRYYNQIFSSALTHEHIETPILLLDAEEALQSYVKMHMAENFADIYAAGEFIRGGKELSFIDDVVTARAFEGDIIHFSGPALQGLKEEIELLGLDNFRSLSEGDVLQMYYRTVEDYALNMERMKLKLTDEHARHLEKQAEWQARGVKEENTAAMEQFQLSSSVMESGAFTAAIVSILGGGAMETDDILRSKEMNEKIAAWKPMEILQADSLQHESSISPASLSRAYVRHMDKLADLARADPDNAVLYGRQAEKLKVEFIDKALWAEFTAKPAALQP